MRHKQPFEHRPLAGGGRRAPHIVTERERQKATTIRVTCEGCGAPLFEVKERAFHGTPSTHAVLLNQAMRKHVATTGCPGHKPEDAGNRPLDHIVLTAVRPSAPQEIPVPYDPAADEAVAQEAP